MSPMFPPGQPTSQVAVAGGHPRAMRVATTLQTDPRQRPAGITLDYEGPESQQHYKEIRPPCPCGPRLLPQPRSESALPTSN
ncbi:hypothetical protein U2A4042630013 [Corynebacterium striatum]|nr:hypothetical protein U2A4042630013 [Corynebacterium striatum]